MNPKEKNLIYDVASEYLVAYEPAEVEEFEIVFDTTFKVLNRQSVPEPAPDIHGRLPFDSAFVDVTAIASVTWMVTLLVRTLAAGKADEDVARRLDDLGKQLVEHTGQTERVTRILAGLEKRLEDLIRLKEGRLGNSAPRSFEWSRSVDWVLHVERARLQGENVLRFQLTNATAEPLLVDQAFESDPHEYFRTLFERIEEVGTADDRVPDRRRAQRKIEGIGATVAEQVLPRELRNRLLASVHEPAERALSLVVISNDPWIPWELLRLRDAQGRGPFLGEAFAMTRWPFLGEPTLELPLDQIGLVVVDPVESGLPATANEKESIRTLGQNHQRRVEDVPARFNDNLDGFASRRFNGWHFCGHADAGGGNPDLFGIRLEDGDSLDASHLKGAACDLSPRRPLIFLNACRSARMALALNGIGGMAQAFLDIGAGAFLGSHWAVEDEPAKSFAEAFYRSFIADGVTIGEAVRRARLSLHDEFPGDPSWLAYTVFAHPLASSPSTSASISGEVLREEIGKGR